MKPNPWRRIAMAVCAMLFVLMVAASFRFFQSRGVFTSVEPKQYGQCRTLALAGVRDLVVDPAAKTAYVAVDGQTAQDGLYTYAYGQPGAQLVKLSGTSKGFHPRAIALSRGADGTSTLRAIFGRDDKTFSIAVFKTKPGAVEELGRISADILIDPSDLVSLDQDRFYILNRHTTRTAFGRWLDDTFLLPRANILYFDGMRFLVVAKQLNAPNGIALSPDGSHLYVAETFARSLISFERNIFAGGLQNPKLLSIPSGLQKVDVMPDGSLIVAAQPKLSSDAAASQVYRVSVRDGVPQSADLLYASRDMDVTAAAETNGHLLLGSSKGLTDCAS